MVGGVATSSGDFRWTSIVDRCRVVEERPDRFGTKAAVVGEFGSPFVFPEPSFGPRIGVEVISATQGVSKSDVSQRSTSMTRQE